MARYDGGTIMSIMSFTSSMNKITFKTVVAVSSFSSGIYLIDAEVRDEGPSLWECLNYDAYLDDFTKENYVGIVPGLYHCNIEFIFSKSFNGENTEYDQEMELKDFRPIWITNLNLEETSSIGF